MRIVTIEIVAKVRDKDFTHDNTESFIKAEIAVFRGFFPNAGDVSGEPPITVTVNEGFVEEDNENEDD